MPVLCGVWKKYYLMTGTFTVCDVENESQSLTQVWVSVTVARASGSIARQTPIRLPRGCPQRMSNLNILQMFSFYILLGFPTVIAYAVVGLEWALDVGAFVCAWWACWILWAQEREQDE